MQENTSSTGGQSPAQGTPPQSTFSVSPTSSAHNRMSTEDTIMSATPIENALNAKSSVAVWMGFGLILIAMIIAGTYYYMTVIEPPVGPEIPTVNIPVETDEERAIRDLDTISTTLDASLDFTDIDAELDAITSDLKTVQ